MLDVAKISVRDHNQALFVITMKDQRKIEQKHLKMEEVLQKLNDQFIRLKTSDRKCNNFILHSVLQSIIQKMRTCDNLFDNMKPRLDYLGSYYDGLRVGEPTEYDINIILHIPINNCKIVLDSSNSECGHTSITLPSEFRRLANTPETAGKGFVKTQAWCDSNHRLSMLKFHSWMQSVIDTTLKSLPYKNGKRVLMSNNINYYIESKRSGPANTIIIIKEDNTVIDVDLVPTFAFNLPKIPIKSTVCFKKVEDTKTSQYFVVPKPTSDEFCWRLTFPIQERFLIKNKHNLKCTLRLLKHLRDVQGFKKLSSYYIKTLFLWEMEANNENFWVNKSLTFLLLYMLKVLRESLLKGIIKNYWCPEHNLIGKLKRDTCLNWGNRLTYIINELEMKGKKNALIIFKYFTNNHLDK
ncbi:cyclic GMP-AMP synthase-like receptor [Battus philenor]|uniref:cyclic GMP-AMP synthase-like receptor n=1 Tax=Battus philenor TaxID=42288 RepID=UPI0035D03877